MTTQNHLAEERLPVSKRGEFRKASHDSVENFPFLVGHQAGNGPRSKASRRYVPKPSRGATEEFA